MGSKSDHSRNRDTDIAEKNKQIANLETQIEAHIARTSHLHARLLSTLDALDDVQAHYAHDVASLRRTKDRLSDKLDRYITFVNTIEDEKDDMRDAVLKLVEKVEQCSDYTQWPQSRMRITSLLDPLAHEHAHHEKSNDDLFAYAAAMIGSLTQARDAERDAHAHTLHHVAALEAQLARRDAELAQCTYDHRPRHMPYEPHPRAKSPRADLVMSQDEAITVLTMTSAKNKALEMEVKVLAERLENARATTGSAARRVDATSAGKDAQDGNAHASSSARRETQPATTGLHPVAASPPSTRTTVPDSGPSASDRREGPGRLRPPQIEASGDTVAHSRSRDTPRRAPRPPRETRRDQSRARSQGPRRRHPQAHSRERRQSSPENALMPLVPTRDASPPLQMESSSAVAALERQVRALASTVDAFKEERRLLGEVLQRERPSTVRQKPDQVAISESSVLVSQPESSQPRKLHAEPQNGLGFGSVRSLEDRLREMEEHLRAAEERLGENEERCRQTEARLQVREDECTRLARSEQALRDQLALSEIRERELLGEINHLKRRSSQSPGQPAERRSSMPLALEPSAESDGEKSMDLATPLHSIVILPTVSDSQAVDPPSIPLPLSPSSSGSESSWATSLGSPSPASSRRLSTSVPMLSDRSTASVEALPISTGSRGRRYDMEEIEEELALTRRELEMREDAMRELRGLVAHLQRQIATDDGSETIVIGFVPP